MDDQRRQRLAESRAMAQRRIERARESARFRALAPLLCDRGIRFARVPPAALRTPLAPFNALPGRDERVWWPEVPDGHCAAWDGAAACEARLREAFGAVGAGRVILAFHPLEAALSIDAADLAAAWAELHDQFYDTLWIVPRRGGGWLVEISFLDQDLCWLRT